MTFPDTDLRKASENPLTSVFPRVALGQKPYHRDERIAKIIFGLSKFVGIAYRMP